MRTSATSNRRAERHTHESFFSYPEASQRRHHHHRTLRIFTIVALALGFTAAIALSGTARRAEAATPAVAAPKGALGGNRLVIPSIGFNKQIVVGWTREINQGKIVMIGDCWPDNARTASLPCSTTWIAGHHTTHGSPFRKLANVKIGALVTIIHDGRAYTYKIFSKISANRAQPPKWVFAQDLLLQTSNGGSSAWALNGTLVSTKWA